MLTNKWFLMGMSALSTTVAYLATVDWNTLVPSKAGMVVMGLTATKAVLTSFLPSPARMDQAVLNSKMDKLNGAR